MFVPYRTSRRQKYWPIVNLTLIAINLIAFALTWQQMEASDVGPLATYEVAREAIPVMGFYLQPQHFEWWQLLSYTFLHGGVWHLVMNMVFLFVFGNAVEDRLGRLGYLAFYLAAGVVAGMVHIATVDAPVIGASGAVAGVTGAFLVLYPRVEMEILFIVIPVERTFPGWVIICIYVALDVYNLLSDAGTNVAYTAHLGGYGFGFVVCMLLLALRLIDREPYDLFADMYHIYRRRRFRKQVARGYDPWVNDDEIERPNAATTTLSPAAEAIRRRVHSRVRRREYEQAAIDYRALQQAASGTALRPDAQMDVANQLMTEGDHSAAAGAYDLLITAHGSDPLVPRAQLLLGLIYTRYLDRPADAQMHLKKASRSLAGEDRAMADTLLTEAQEAANQS